MPFILTGFRQVAGLRVFAFEGTGKDTTPTKLTVRADINLGRKHGIQLQDWPLLCIEMLELRSGDITPGTCDLIFDETRMCELEAARVATRLAASLKRARAYKPPAAQPLPAFAATV
jgi:hypothetical protein